MSDFSVYANHFNECKYCSGWKARLEKTGTFAGYDAATRNCADSVAMFEPVFEYDVLCPVGLDLYRRTLPL